MRIIVFGANGMQGHKMYQVLSKAFPETWAVMRKELKNLPYKGMYAEGKVIDKTDLRDFSAIGQLLDSINPDVIVNCAGITTRRTGAGRVSETIVMNAALPHFLDEWVTGKKGKRLVSQSTDCVFSGKKGAYTETDITDAQDYYGRSKAMGEVSGPQSLTLRGSIIGREIDNHTELLEWFLSQKGKTIKGFSNVLFSGITTLRMAQIIQLIISDFPDLSGIYNVASEPISKYELLLKLNKAFGTDTGILEDGSYTARKDLVAERFYQAIGKNLPNWDEMIAELYEDSQLNSALYKK